MIDNAMCQDMLTDTLRWGSEQGNTETVMRMAPHVVIRLEAYEQAIRDLRHLLDEESYPQYDPNTGKSCRIVGIKSVNKILEGVPTVR